VRARGLDHVVLWVTDVEASVRWYRDLLGVEVDRLDEWRRGEVPFPSLRIDEWTVIDLFEVPEGDPERRAGGTDHVALVVEDVDLDVLATMGERGVEGPPRSLWGAQGAGKGIYLRDPDGNRVELRVYD